MAEGKPSVSEIPGFELDLIACFALLIGGLKPSGGGEDLTIAVRILPTLNEDLCISIS
ncbi:MAG: hypothetical protein NTW84_03200 [Methanothrix sp.]|jgi:hypothetical protein|nr:hypothetical protein [Methanothrix sp.]